MPARTTPHPVRWSCPCPSASPKVRAMHHWPARARRAAAAREMDRGRDKHENTQKSRMHPDSSGAPIDRDRPEQAQPMETASAEQERPRDWLPKGDIGMDGDPAEP